MSKYKDMDFQGAKKLREKLQKERQSYDVVVAISNGTCARAVGSQGVVDTFKEEIKNQKLEDKVNLIITSCQGLCAAEPNVLIYLYCQDARCQEPILYQKLKPKDVKEIISKTIINKKIIKRLLYVDPVAEKKIAYRGKIPFFNLQDRLVLSQEIHAHHLLNSEINADWLGNKQQIVELRSRDVDAIHFIYGKKEED